MSDAAEQEAVIDFLSRGAAYGQPDANVARIDTHASVVFLVADRAFKLKRAIRFSYLDYSTVEKREAMCRAECDLNRRTAPQLYRGVQAVTREADGTLALGGKGRPVDWLVAMKQFPQENLFDRLAERRRLTPALMRDLADEIAAFHAGADACGTADHAQAMRDIATENLDNLRRTRTALNQDRITSLARATAAALDRAAPLLKGRETRRCHGDLHLRNICLLDDRPVLFDGIEFNDAFTCIDPLYDLAFLLMDLDHRGFDDLGNIVFNRYLDRSASNDALALLPLYLSIRAGVRAHVSVAALERQGDDRKRHDLAQDAAHYLDAAERFLWTAQPRLIAIGGLSGSGKSTIAQTLAPGFAPVPGARLLRSDVLRKLLAGVAPETRLPPAAYDKASNERVYAGLYDAAAAALAAGYSVIVDAAFLDPAERGAIAAVAAAAKLPFTGFWADAPVVTLRRRIAARKGDASDADLTVLDFQLGRDLGPISWHRLAADAAVASIAAAARRVVEGTGER